MKTMLIDMAIKGMKHSDIQKQFDELCQKGTNPDVLLTFLEHVIPLYEASKQKVFSEIFQTTYIDIIDQMWEDPADVYIYQRMSELKKLSKILNIELNASKSKKH